MDEQMLPWALSIGGHIPATKRDPDADRSLLEEVVKMVEARGLTVAISMLRVGPVTIDDVHR